MHSCKHTQILFGVTPTRGRTPAQMGIKLHIPPDQTKKKNTIDVLIFHLFNSACVNPLSDNFPKPVYCLFSFRGWMRGVLQHPPPNGGVNPKCHALGCSVVVVVHWGVSGSPRRIVAPSIGSKSPSLDLINSSFTSKRLVDVCVYVGRLR